MLEARDVASFSVRTNVVIGANVGWPGSTHAVASAQRAPIVQAELTERQTRNPPSDQDLEVAPPGRRQDREG